MTILHKKSVALEAFNTDDFTKDEWIVFIRQHLSATQILRMLEKKDLFGLELLKEYAVKSAQIDPWEFD